MSTESSNHLPISGQPGGEPRHVLLDGAPISCAQLDGLLDCRLAVTIGDKLWAQVDASRDRVEALLKDGKAYYGVNTGFGSLCRVRIEPDQLDQLQENLIVSHAAGVGSHAPSHLIRWMMLFKVHALLKGFSGVRRDVIDCLTAMINHDLLPAVPDTGSLGASGDLAPLAHMVLPMIGRGQVYTQGKLTDAAQACSAAGIKPIRLSAKEGLALINGTQFMAAYGAGLIVRARRLAKHADVIATMSLEGTQGSIKPFDERLFEIRPHVGAGLAADNVRVMMRDSENLMSHADCGRVQDPYSVRCVPQVHGASRDAIEHAAEVVECDINSVTDNPVIFDNGEAISGGNFHGQSLALVLDYLAMALAELANISERRIYYLLSGPGDLPQLLMKDTGLNSGFMLPQYTAAALVNVNKTLCTPASVDSIPTSLGQEDHVSMGANSALKAWRIMDNAETVLAIEMMCAAQAMDYRAEHSPGLGPRAAHATVRKVIGYAEQDRLFGEDIKKSLDLLRSQRVLRAVEHEVGLLK